MPDKKDTASFALNSFKSKKIMDIDTLAKLLERSIPTVRRRLQQWGTHTSYNFNGRYYTLPDIPKFDENGIWKYKEVLFSKHGNLRQAVIHLVKHSLAGVTTKESEEVLQVSMGAFMPSFRNIPQLCRVKVAGEFVYFSSEKPIFNKQKKNRLTNIKKTISNLPTDAEAVIVLVEWIKYPKLNIEELAARLTRKGHLIKAEIIGNLFQRHGLLKKTLDMQQ